MGGTGVRRPGGQTAPRSEDAPPSFGPSRSFDYELEVGAFLGPGNDLGDSIPLAEAESHLEHLRERWRTSLADVEEERFDHPTHTSGWGVDYCVDAMLEHAVMHPMRHRFQLEEWIEETARRSESSDG